MMPQQQEQKNQAIRLKGYKPAVLHSKQSQSKANHVNNKFKGGNQVPAVIYYHHVSAWSYIEHFKISTATTNFSAFQN